MTTTNKKIQAYASILGFGALMVFGGCVKKHKEQSTNTDSVFAIGNVGIEVEDQNGNKPGVLNTGLYMVQDDYVGCSESEAEIQAASNADDNKSVVTLNDGTKAACVKPAALAKMTLKPKVTFFKAPGETDYFIQTRNVLKKSSRTESQNGVVVQGDVGIRVLDIVDFTTNSPILNEIKDRVDLRALPGETYKVYHKLTPKVLYVMKVSTEDKLSHLDLPIADNLGNGEFAVPVAAVEINLSEYRAIRNLDNEASSRFDFFNTESLSEATHIKFSFSDVKSVELPEDASKDVYPADYFTKGKWYFAESVVDTRPGSEGLIGTVTGAFDTEFRPATLIQFTRSGASLIGCNVGVDLRYAGDHKCDESASVVTVPSTGHSFKLDTVSTDVDEHKILSSEAPYLKLNLQGVSTIMKSIDEINSIFRDTNADQITSIEFHKNRFNFVTQRGANGRKVMFSFLRADNRPAYEARRHYKDDRQNKFGYFIQTKAEIRKISRRTGRVEENDVIAREEDLEKDYLVQRHNPTQDIVFHFSKGITPENTADETDRFGLQIDYREIGRKSIEYWNKAYERAGAPNRVVLAEEDAPFGDIAFNTMNLIDSERGSNLLGVGPSLVDPYSGEVINANANVYIAPFREIVANSVRNYIKSRTGYLEEPSKQLPESALRNSTLLGEIASTIDGAKSVIADVIPDDVLAIVANFYHYGTFDFTVKPVEKIGAVANSNQVANLYDLGKFNSENSMIQKLLSMSKRLPIMQKLVDAGEITFEPRSRKDVLNLQRAWQIHRPTFYRAYFMAESAEASDYNTMTSDIEAKCDDVLTLVSFINQRAIQENAPTRLTTEEELPALRHCMTQIIPAKFQATLIHEIGHTLGLRHNFKASADEQMFFKRDEIKELYGVELGKNESTPKSSSVMDYMRTEQDRLIYPGHYDIAAIRYGYANSVEVLSSVERPNTLQGKYVKLSDDITVTSLTDYKEQLALLKSKVFNNPTDQIEKSVKALEDFISQGLSGKIYDFLDGVDQEKLKVDLDYAEIVDSKVYEMINTADPLSSIETRLAKLGHSIKPYSYCTDVSATLEIDPLCARHDFGTNPKMLVEDTINTFWESFTLYNFRYDRLRAGLTGPFGRNSRMQKLKRVYNEWRVKLARHLGGTDSTSNVYLQRYTPEQYEQLLTELRTDESFDGQEYLEVRDQIFDFVLDVAFFPNKYCMVDTPAGLKAIEFTKIRDELKNQVDRGTKIASCDNVDVVEKIASKGYTYLYEAGLPVDNLWYLVNPNDTFEESADFRSFRAPLDVVGSFLDRYFASSFIGDRSSGYTGVLEKIFPSMMDEPDLLVKFEQRMIERLTQGADLKSVFVRANKDKAPKKISFDGKDEITVESLPLDTKFLNFSSENALLKAMWTSLENGVFNQFADRPEVTRRYTRQVTDNPDVINGARQNGGFVLPLTTGDSVVVTSDASTVFALAQRITEIGQIFGGANQEIPTADQLKEGVSEIILRVSDDLELQDGQTEISVQQYLIFARNMNALMNSHPIKEAAIQQTYIAELAPYLIFLKSAEDAIAQAQEAGQEPPAGAVQAAQSILAEWTSKGMSGVIEDSQAWLNQNQFHITAVAPNASSVLEKFSAVEPAIVAAVNEATQQRNSQRTNLDVNGDELFAQYELLRSILGFNYRDINVDLSLRFEELGVRPNGDAYDSMIKSKNPYVRAFAQDHLNPRLIAKKQWGFDFQADKLSKRKF